MSGGPDPSDFELTEDEKGKYERFVAEANHAKQLLADPMLADAFDSTAGDFLNAIQNSEPEETQKREDAYYELRAVKRFRGKLTKHIDTGKVARRRLGLDEEE